MLFVVSTAVAPSGSSWFGVPFVVKVTIPARA